MYICKSLVNNLEKKLKVIIKLIENSKIQVTCSLMAPMRFSQMGGHNP